MNSLKVRDLIAGVCILIILAVGCKSSKIVFATVEDNILEVNLEYLIDNISKYHGKTVQAKGIFSIGFEDCSIAPAMPMFDSVKNQFYLLQKSLPGMWVELDSKFMPFDSVYKYNFRKTGNLSVLQGKVDTSKTGHMGSYAGAIVDARFVMSR